MGQTGVGKSTLLNILAMLDKPTEGRVFLNGTDTATIKNSQASSFRRGELGFVFQEFKHWKPSSSRIKKSKIKAHKILLKADFST